MVDEITEQLSPRQQETMKESTAVRIHCPVKREANPG